MPPSKSWGGLPVVGVDWLQPTGTVPYMKGGTLLANSAGASTSTFQMSGAFSACPMSVYGPKTQTQSTLPSPEIEISGGLLGPTVRVAWFLQELRGRRSKKRKSPIPCRTFCRTLIHLIRLWPAPAHHEPDWIDVRDGAAAHEQDAWMGRARRTAGDGLQVDQDGWTKVEKVKKSRNSEWNVASGLGLDLPFHNSSQRHLTQVLVR